MGIVRNLLFPSHDLYGGLEVLPFNNHGWASEAPEFAMAIALCNPSLIVEVGTWMGGSARNMANQIKNVPNAEVVCIDTFLGSVEHWTRESYLMTNKNGRPNIYEQFLSNNLHCGLRDIITPFPCDSINGYLTLKKFNIVPDMVYVDAGHDYDSVKADITRWGEILRVGGVMLLDDAHHPPIQQAVADAIPTATRSGNKFIWQKS